MYVCVGVWANAYTSVYVAQMYMHVCSMYCQHCVSECFCSLMCMSEGCMYVYTRICVNAYVCQEKLHVCVCVNVFIPILCRYRYVIMMNLAAGPCMSNEWISALRLCVSLVALPCTWPRNCFTLITDVGIYNTSIHVHVHTQWHGQYVVRTIAAGQSLKKIYNQIYF